MRSEPQDTDYGIDLEVELASQSVSGRLFKVQVKGHSSISWPRSNSLAEGIREETLRYWRVLPLPVLLLSVDVSTEAAYWAPAQVRDGSAAVFVPRRNDLPATAQKLEEYVIDWLDGRSLHTFIYALPFLASVWRQICENTGYDIDSGPDPDQTAALERAYAQIRHTRLALGLNPPTIPWVLWYARSAALYDVMNELTWGVYDEVVAYLRPYVEEMFVVGKQRLDAEEWSPENTSAKLWSDPLGIAERIGEQFYGLGPEFWQRIDALLARQGAQVHHVAEILRERERRRTEGGAS